MRVFALPRPAYPGRRRCSLCRGNFKIKYHWLPTHGMRWSSQTALKLITCETDNNCCNRSRQVQHSNPVLEGQLTIVTVFQSGYKFFWIGRHSEELREVGMGFSVRIDLINFTKTFSKDSVMASYLLSVHMRRQWRHSNHWHLIDYVIVTRRDGLCSADCWIDRTHHLKTQHVTSCPAGAHMRNLPTSGSMSES